MVSSHCAALLLIGYLANKLHQAPEVLPYSMTSPHHMATNSVMLLGTSGILRALPTSYSGCIVGKD